MAKKNNSHANNGDDSLLGTDGDDNLRGGNGKDILEMATCMGLNQEESEYLHFLQVGEVIASLKERIFVPLHLHFPKIGIRKGQVSDEQLASRR